MWNFLLKGILSAFNKALENRKRKKFEKKKNQNVIADRLPHQENGDTPGQSWSFVVVSTILLFH